MKFEKISIKEVIKKYLDDETIDLYVKKDDVDFLKVVSMELNFDDNCIGIHTLEYYDDNKLVFNTDVRDDFYIMAKEEKPETKEIKIILYNNRGTNYFWINGYFSSSLDGYISATDFDKLIYNAVGLEVISEMTQLRYDDYRESSGTFETLMDWLIDEGEDLTPAQFTALFEEQEWEDIEKVFADILDEIEEG